MIRGWYTGASGMNAQQNRLDAISNNLANVDTAGYKRDITVSKSFPELLIRRTNADGVNKIPNGMGSFDAAPVIGKLGLGVETNENYVDFSQGSFKLTNTRTDVALGGKGFYVIDTPAGERYTRNGDFFIGKEGILETKDGYPVLGENGIIRVENDRFESMDSTNDIAGPAHIAEGNERPRFVQSYTETSNVNVVNEMVQMIEVNRAYEANQKTITSEDSMMGTLWQKVAVLQ